MPVATSQLAPRFFDRRKGPVGPRHPVPFLSLPPSSLTHHNIAAMYGIHLTVTQACAPSTTRHRRCARCTACTQGGRVSILGALPQPTHSSRSVEDISTISGAYSEVFAMSLRCATSFMPGSILWPDALKTPVHGKAPTRLR